MSDQFVPLKQAAELLGRSTARTRQYLHDGKFGDEGQGWKRDEMGHILVNVAAVKSYEPTGTSRQVAGVKAGTQLRHVRATIKMVESAFPESDARRVTKAMLDKLVQALEDKAAHEDTGVKEAPVAPATAAVATPAAAIETEDEDFEEGLINL